MRKFSLLIAGLLSAFCAISCLAQNPEKCVVDGTLPQDVNLNGKYIYLIAINEANPRGEKIDSAKVEDNKFHMELTPNEKLANLYLTAYRFRTPIILEAGQVMVNMSEASAKGTKLNNILFAYSTEKKKEADAIAPQIEQLKKDYQATGADKDAIEKKYEELVTGVQTKLNGLAYDVLKKNADNVLGVYAFQELIQNQAPEELLTEAKALASQEVLSNFVIKKHFEFLDNQKKTLPGQMFLDFAGVDDDNKAVKLSDYVGKGKYVIVDFWASWCGPCRREIPNIKKLREMYSDKELTIIGVAVWDQMDKHLASVKKEGVTWPQIFNKQEATELYAIKGIPQIMLFAPDGKIVARDLRGETMFEAVKEALKK